MARTNENESTIETYLTTPRRRQSSLGRLEISSWDIDSDGEFHAQISTISRWDETEKSAVLLEPDQAFAVCKALTRILPAARRGELVKELTGCLTEDERTDLAAEIAGIELPAKETE